MSHDRWMGVALVAENINNQTETLGCCLRWFYYYHHNPSSTRGLGPSPSGNVGSWHSLSSFRRSRTSLRLNDTAARSILVVNMIPIPRRTRVRQSDQDQTKQYEIIRDGGHQRIFSFSLYWSPPYTHSTRILIRWWGLGRRPRHFIYFSSSSYCYFTLRFFLVFLLPEKTTTGIKMKIRRKEKDGPATFIWACPLSLSQDQNRVISPFGKWVVARAKQRRTDTRQKLERLEDARRRRRQSV